MSQVEFADARLAALETCQVIDTPREPMFDNVVFTLAQLFRASIAGLILVGNGEEWVKASVGPLALHWDRVSLFCRTVVETGELLVLEGNQTDPRFAGPFQVPPVAGTRISIAIPLIGPGGHRIGALCVLDSQLRPGVNRQFVHLQQLADQAGELLRLRVVGLDLEDYRRYAR